MVRRRAAPIVFAAVAHPEVSVLIPVYNHLETTRRCLATVAADDSGLAFEVIVLDDASTDRTATRLARVPNLRVVRSEQNAGFVHNSNSGAQHARGRFLLFLNNDTLMGSGAMAALVRTMRSDPRIGIVGPRLLNRDGSVQEAGAITWSDGTPMPYGSGWPRHDPRIQHRRDVDYISGACLLVRRECWNATGGFDAQFAPAYFEDVDLAFSARALGYRVVYEPRAEVVHLAGVSHGTDVTSATKRFQELNRPKFVAKWRSELRRQHSPATADVARARDRRERHVLVVDQRIPHPDRDSGSLRMAGLLRVLAELGFAIHLLPDNGMRDEPYASELDALGIEVLSGYTDGSQAVRQLGSSIDLAILSRAGPASRFVLTVREVAPHAVALFDTVDMHALRWRRAAVCEHRDDLLTLARSTEEIELALARHAMRRSQSPVSNVSTCGRSASTGPSSSSPTSISTRRAPPCPTVAPGCCSSVTSSTHRTSTPFIISATICCRGSTSGSVRCRSPLPGRTSRRPYASWLRRRSRSPAGSRISGCCMTPPASRSHRCATALASRAKSPGAAVPVCRPSRRRSAPKGHGCVTAWTSSSGTISASLPITSPLCTGTTSCGSAWRPQVRRPSSAGSVGR